MVQFCLITALTPTVTSVFAWALLMAAMTVPYVFAGITVSLALTRSPFPVSQVYGVDLLGAALGCAAVVGILNVLDGPSAILFAGLAAAAGGVRLRARGGGAGTSPSCAPRPLARVHCRWCWSLAVLIPLNMSVPVGFKPLMVKDAFESSWRDAHRALEFLLPDRRLPAGRLRSRICGGLRRSLDKSLTVRQAGLNIDGAAGTTMLHFDGTNESIDFLRYDLVNLAYHLPGIAKSAVIGVGGGRDLHVGASVRRSRTSPASSSTRSSSICSRSHPFYAPYSNLTAIPGLKLHVDDARSWFAATQGIVRPDPDEHDRHLGRDGGGRLLAQRKRSLHP